MIVKNGFICVFVELILVPCVKFITVVAREKPKQYENRVNAEQKDQWARLQRSLDLTDNFSNAEF